MRLLRSTGLAMTRPPLLHLDDWRKVTGKDDEMEYRNYLQAESGITPLPEVI